MTDFYIVVARLDDGPIVRIADTLSTDWQLVQARWRWLDEAQRTGHLYVEDDRHDTLLYLRPARLVWLAVRTLDDPAIARTSTIALSVTTGSGTKDRGSIARRWGKANGYHGHVGGWIYRNPCRPGESVVRQGWTKLIPRRAIGCTLTSGDVRYHRIKDIREVNHVGS